MPFMQRPRGRSAGSSTAAVLREEGEQRIHSFVVRRVIDESTLLTRLQQAGVAENFQVKGQGIGRYLQPFSDLAGGQAFGTGLHQQPIQRQSALLGERAQRRY